MALSFASSIGEEDRRKRKIDDNLAKQLSEEHDSGLTLTSLANRLGTTHHTVRRAIHRVGGKTWTRAEAVRATYEKIRKNSTGFLPCSVCKKEKPAKDFYVLRSGRPVIKGTCKDCVCYKSSKNYAENKLLLMAKMRAARWRFKLELIEAYGGICACCGEKNQEFLNLDHINGGGSKHRDQVGGNNNLYRLLRRQGYPKDGFRLLCYNCNCARGAYGYCPHEKTREEGKR